MNWISVKDQLPEKMVDVLINQAGEDQYGFVYPGIYMAYIDEEGEWTDTVIGDGGGVVSTQYVTHWMPLPKPPTDEKGNLI